VDDADVGTGVTVGGDIVEGIGLTCVMPSLAAGIDGLTEGAGDDIVPVGLSEGVDDDIDVVGLSEGVVVLAPVGIGLITGSSMGCLGVVDVVVLNGPVDGGAGTRIGLLPMPSSMVAE
jgi:hypothetical protein